MSGRIKKVISAVLSAVMLASAVPAAMAAEGDEPTAAVSGYVSMTNDGGILLASRTKTPVIHVDDSDYAGVKRAANDLVNDIKAVTGVKPTMGDADKADVVIGTIGESAAINALVSGGSLDVSEIEGKWESFTIQNVGGTIVIAGSDKRGTIYGIYDLSEKIGVSPWYFWADVVIGHADALYINLPADGYTEGEPSVKYRGIFLNDEYNLEEWSKSMGSGNMNNETYEKIFELLLRLKANYLWPAMHKYSTAFNVTPNNAKLADEYGIVMGSSHCEPILRNNLGELYTFQQGWLAEYPDKKLYINTKDESGHNVSWMWTDKDNNGNAVDNKEFLTDYWRTRLEANSGYENTYTLGMRGVHDGSFDTNVTTSWTAEVQDIIDVQTALLEAEAEKLGVDVSDIPQVFIPYKEMLDYYNKGLNVPDYVTLMWPDDNFGYIRQLPTEEEAQRSGGAGIYYHLSYYGRPTSYLWLSTTSPALIREEMTKAYDMGAQTIWVANVGDLKPAETEIEYFLDLARDVETMRDKNIYQWLAGNAQRDFGFDDLNALLYASLKTMYYNAVSSRRPEHMAEGLYSLTDFGDEGQQLLDYYNELEQGARKLYDKLPDSQKPSFYELLLYPLLGAKSMTEKYIYADKAKYYAENNLGAAANKYAALSDAANAQIDADTAVYTSMLNGKWAKMMNPRQTQLSGSFGGTITGALNPPTVTTVPYTKMTIVPEGGKDTLEFLGPDARGRFIDIINSGSGSFDWRATTDKDWIKINKTSGTVADDDRIYVAIELSDDHAREEGTIKFERVIGDVVVDTQTVTVARANTTKPSALADIEIPTYVEGNGYVSIEAEHYSNSVAKGDYEWKVEKELGRSGDSVKIYPNRAAKVKTPNMQNSAYLEYQVYFTSSGEFPIDVYRMPTLNELSGASLSYQIGVDENTPVRFSCNRAAKDKSDGTDVWGKGVLQNTDIVSGKINIPSEGLHTIRLYNEDPGVVIDKFVITTGEKKASYFGAPESYNTRYSLYPSTPSLPKASTPADKQTGNVTALFEPEWLIMEVNKSKDYEGAGTVKVVGVTEEMGDYTFVIASYDSNGNMIDAAFTPHTMNPGYAGPYECLFPSVEGAEKVQVMLLKGYDIDANDYEPAASALEVNVSDISLFASYDNGYVYPMTKMGDYIGRESVCVISDEQGTIKYIRQNTVSEDTYSKIPFNGEGKHTLKIKIAGEDGIITETFNTVHNIDPNVDPKSETLYNWDFSTDQTGTGKNVPVLSGPAVYDETNKCIKLTNEAKSGGSVTATFDAPISASQGEAIVIKTDIAYGHLSGKYTDYVIKDSAGNELVRSHINGYAGSTQSIKVGGVEQLDGSTGRPGMPSLGTGGTFNAGALVTYTTTIDVSANTITLTTHSSAGDREYVGKLPSGSSYDVASVTVSTTHDNTGRTSYVDNISVTKSKAAAYGMTFKAVNAETETEITDAQITVKDGITGAVIAPENGTYILCDGIYNYTVKAEGYETVDAVLELSPATEGYEITVPMNEANYDYKITGDVKNSVLNAKIFDNVNDKDVTAYIAEYNDKNALIKVTMDKEVRGGKEIKNYALDENTALVKILLWEGNSMKPVIDTVFEAEIVQPEPMPTPTPTPTPIPDTRNTADITIKFADEEGNKLKDDVVMSGVKYDEGATYTVPDEYRTDFVLKKDGLYNLYKFNESTSQLTAMFEKEMTLTLRFNNTDYYNFYEDFENVTSTSDWKTGSGSVAPTIETDKTTYLKHSTGSSSTGAYTTFEKVDTENKVAKITADVKFTEVSTSGAGLGQFAISNSDPKFSSNNINYGIENSSGHILTLMYKGGTTLVFNKKTANIDFKNQWIHVDADADFGQGKVTVTLTNENGDQWTGEDDFYSGALYDNINVGSMYLRSPGVNGTLSVDNVTVKITGEALPAEPNIKSEINYKSVYAFGDSIVYGHNAPTKSFMRLIANDYAIKLNMMAKNGATIMSSSNQILSQINSAPPAAPDIVVLEGYTNDAYGSAASDPEFNPKGTERDVTACYGTVSPEGTTAFDTNTFCGSFENTIKTIKDKWPEAKIVFVTIHESNARNHDIQVKLRELSMEACEKWDIPVVDMFTYENESGERLNTYGHTKKDAYMNKYIINGEGSHPTEDACREFYIPAVVEVLEGLYK